MGAWSTIVPRASRKPASALSFERPSGCDPATELIQRSVKFFSQMIVEGHRMVVQITQQRRQLQSLLLDLGN